MKNPIQFCKACLKHIVVRSTFNLSNIIFFTDAVIVVLAYRKTSKSPRETK